MFSTLTPRESAVDACARAIREAIVRGELAPGAKLPPERQLADTFGVNRMTLRGALTRLAAARLLSVRQGSGYVVLDYRRGAGPELLPGVAELAGARGELADVARDLLLVRRHLARAVLEHLAASRASALGIRRAIEAFAEGVAAGASKERIAELDLDIVAAVLDATKSPVLALCFHPIARVVGELPELRDAMYVEPAENARAYGLLAGWLKERRPELIDAIIGELARRDAATVARLGKKKERKG